MLGPEWRYVGRLAYIAPVAWIGYGLFAEPSITGNFYLRIVRRPMYEPTDVLDLSYSDRVGGGSHFYSLNDPSTEAVVRDAARRVSAERAHPTTIVLPVENPGMQEVRGYANLLEGNLAAAVADLRAAAAVDDDRPWVLAMVARAMRNADAIEGGDIDPVLDEIRGWRLSAGAALRLELDPDPQLPRLSGRFSVTR
jgi:hypothetical protein